MGPTLSSGPTAEDVAAIDDPFQRIKAINEVARRCGTLPTALHRLRRADLVALRARRDTDGRPLFSAGAIAERVGLSRPRIFQLTKTPAGQE